jgi:hypothetical protein
MKQITKILAILAFLAVASAQAAVDLTDNLKLRGFVDSSYRSIDDTSDLETLGVNNFDVDFLFGFDKVNSEVHLRDNGGIEVEQAFVSYGLSDKLTVTAGRYLSLLGYEGDEPYKLYQDSMAYYWHRSSGTDTNLIPFAAYHSGAKISYSSGNVSATISVVDSVYGLGGSNDAEALGFEAQIKYTGVEDFTIQVGTAQEGDGVPAASTTNIDNYFNFWVEYTGMEKTIIGAEYNTYDKGATGSGDSYMVMGNYAVSDAVSLTLRFADVDETGTANDMDKFTVSPSYTFTENLLGRLEYSTGEVGGADVDFFSLGALFTF